MSGCLYYILPVVPARGGAEVALGLYYKTFLIYRTCMRRAPARPVRGCFVRTCCAVVVQEHDLRATPVQCNEIQSSQCSGSMLGILLQTQQAKHSRKGWISTNQNKLRQYHQQTMSSSVGITLCNLRSSESVAREKKQWAERTTLTNTTL